LAGWTGLEPATSGVTGRRYNQLNYHPASDDFEETGIASRSRVFNHYFQISDKNAVISRACALFSTLTDLHLAVTGLYTRKEPKMLSTSAPLTLAKSLVVSVAVLALSLPTFASVKVVKLNGMSCGACVEKLETALEKIDKNKLHGVTVKIEVNKVTLDTEGKTVSPADLKEAEETLKAAVDGVKGITWVGPEKG
jgi:copper chaperone CopZ